MSVSLAAIFLGSLFTMNSTSMETIKMSRESACASQVLQQRVESLRIANWHQVTNADWIKSNLLNASAAGGDALKNVTETLTLIPYGSATIGNTQLQRTAGSATIASQNTALLTENAVKIIWTISYNGAPNDRAITRQTVAILAKGGVAK